MKKTIVLSFLFVLSCATTARDVVVDLPAKEKEYSVSVEMSVGETVALKVPAQLSTGYSWKCSQSSDVATETGKGEVITAGGNIVGAFDTQVIYLKGIKAGSAVLIYQYVRPWENKIKIEKTMQVTVTVK